MKLADFIERNRDAVVEESVEYAATLSPLEGLGVEVLRDHIPLILDAVVLDLRTPQNRAQSRVKSRGEGALRDRQQETAAHIHGNLRAQVGLSIEQLVAEYRALRASVLRRWVEGGGLSVDALAESIRFNEAIDQAVAESVAHFSEEVERRRQIFLGVLGHDLRGPLNAIVLTSELISQLASDARVSEHSTRLIVSGRRMSALLDDLLEYNKRAIGAGIVISPSPVDLAKACQEELEILQAALPNTRLVFDVQGATEGDFDASRIREALANLVSNATHHGSLEAPVRIDLHGTDRHMSLTVENQLKEGTPEFREAMFEPFVRAPDTGRESEHLGLGLFTVREIVRAHGGDVRAHTKDGCVSFTLKLPKGRTRVAGVEP